MEADFPPLNLLKTSEDSAGNIFLVDDSGLFAGIWFRKGSAIDRQNVLNAVKRISDAGSVCITDAALVAVECGTFLVRPFKHHRNIGDAVILGRITQASAQPLTRLFFATIQFPGDIPFLVKTASGDDRVLRHKATEALDRIVSDYPDVLLDEIERNDLRISKELLHLLSKIPGTRSTKQIIRTLDVWTLQEQAVTILVARADTAIADHLVQAWVRNPNHRIEKGLEQISHLAAKQLLTEFERLPSLKYVHCNFLARVAKTEALHFLLGAVCHHHREVRNGAEKALTTLGSVAIQPLLKLAVNQNPRVRLHAVRVLGRFGDESAFPAIADALDDPDRGVRWASLEALDRFPSSTERIVQCLDHVSKAEDRRVRQRVAAMLASHRAPRTAQILWTLCEDADETVRETAVRSLGTICAALPDNVSITKIIKALNDPYDSVRSAALDGLVRVGSFRFAISDGLGREVLQALAKAVEQGEISKDQFTEVLDRITALREDKESFFENFIKESNLGREDDSPKKEVPLPHLPGPVTDDVYFSAVAPAVVAAPGGFVLSVWADLDGVPRRIAEYLLAPEQGTLRIQSVGPVPIEQGSVMKVRLDIPNFHIHGLEETMLWRGKRGSCTFPMHIPEGTALGTHLGTVSVSIDDFAVARVHVAIEVGAQESQLADVTAHVERIYTAFASYASENRNEVLARIQGMQKVLPDLDVFLDVASLRSGGDWAQRIEDAIVRRDTFFLFWSREASCSVWVNREWQIALRRRGLRYIDPVPLEPPDEVPPPLELSSLHFNDWTLAYQQSQRFRSWRKGFQASH